MLKYLLIFVLVSCATNKPKEPKYVYYHPTKNSQEFYKDDADCSAKAGQSSPGLAQSGGNSIYYGSDLSTHLMVSADNKVADARYDLAMTIYMDTKISCMRGNGWIRETEDEFNLRKQSQQSPASNVANNLVCVGEAKELSEEFYTELKRKYNVDELNDLFAKNELIKEIFKSQIPEMKLCYQCYLNNSPEGEKLSGLFNFNITYSSINGKVEESNITIAGSEKSTVLPENLDKCMNDVISGMVFTRLQMNKKISVSFSVNFKPIKKP